MEKRHQKGECPRPRSGKGPGSSSVRETAFSVEFDPDTGGLRTWGRGHALEWAEAGRVGGDRWSKRRDPWKPRSVRAESGVKYGLNLRGLNPPTQSSHRPSPGSGLSPNVRGVVLPPPPPDLGDSCGAQRSGEGASQGAGRRLTPRTPAGGGQGAGSLEVPNPTPCPPPGPVWRGKRSPEAAEPPSSTAPPPRPNRDPRKGRVERKKVREDLRGIGFGDADPPPYLPPHPPLVVGGAASPRPRA